MKIYKVKVNGKLYEVELEEVSETSETIKEVKHKTADVKTNGANIVTAPIAGKVLDVKVSVGDFVKKGQTVAVIEAMKLENEIQSSFEGKVVAVKVSKDDQVKNGDTLVVLG